MHNCERNHFARNIILLKSAQLFQFVHFFKTGHQRFQRYAQQRFLTVNEILSPIRYPNIVGGERERERGRGGSRTASLYILTSIVSGTSLCLGQRTVRLGGTMHRANNSPLKRFHRSWPSFTLLQRPQRSSSLFFNRFSPAPRFFPLPSTTEIAT